MGVGSAFRGLARRVLPAACWSKLRVLRVRHQNRRFKPHEVAHRYGNVDLRIHLADPMAQRWYDCDWDQLDEIEILSRSSLRPGALVFDLGAHQAVVALMLSSVVSPGGKVVAVEANGHNVRVANKNCSLNQPNVVEVVQAAVAERTGRLTFSEQMNGQVDNGTGDWGAVEVDAVTIDQMSDQHGVPDVIFLDVEGYEAKSLAGATRTLEHRPDAYVEVHTGMEPGLGLERFGDTVEDVLRYFPSEFYEVSVIPGARDCKPIPLAEAAEHTSSRFYLVAVSRG